MTSATIAFGLDGALEFLGNALDDLALVTLAALACLVEHAVSHRVEILEAQVLEFDLHAVDAEPVRDRRIDVQRFARDPPAFLCRHGIERLHVVQPVRELDQDHADVLDHREHHLAEALSLRFRPAAELNLVELADAIDEQRDLVAEFFADLRQRCVSVLDDIVQDGSRYGLRVEMHVGEFTRDRDRMRDVGFARLACLAFVRGRSEVVGAHDHADLVLGEVGLQLRDQPLETAVALERGRQLRKRVAA